MLAHQHDTIRKRAEMAQRQRKDAAAAKKAAREKETAAKARKNSCVDTVCTALCSLGKPVPYFAVCVCGTGGSPSVLRCLVEIGAGPMSQRQRRSLGVGETAKLQLRSNDESSYNSSTYW